MSGITSPHLREVVIAYLAGEVDWREVHDEAWYADDGACFGDADDYSDVAMIIQDVKLANDPDPEYRLNADADVVEESARRHLEALLAGADSESYVSVGWEVAFLRELRSAALGESPIEELHRRWSTSDNASPMIDLLHRWEMGEISEAKVRSEISAHLALIRPAARISSGGDGPGVVYIAPLGRSRKAPVVGSTPTPGPNDEELVWTVFNPDHEPVAHGDSEGAAWFGFVVRIGETGHQAQIVKKYESWGWTCEEETVDPIHTGWVKCVCGMPGHSVCGYARRLIETLADELEAFIDIYEGKETKTRVWADESRDEVGAARRFLSEQLRKRVRGGS